MTTRYIAAREAARRIGITTATLAKWRRTGRGPTDFVQLTSTLICYSEDAIEAWIQAQNASFSHTKEHPLKKP